MCLEYNPLALAASIIWVLSILILIPIHQNYRSLSTVQYKMGDILYEHEGSTILVAVGLGKDSSSSQATSHELHAMVTLRFSYQTATCT